MTAQARQLRPVGELVREWREWRRWSRLELASRADISPRQLSLLETGRIAPGHDMVMQLAHRLDLPLRERNYLLAAAGLASAYPERGIDTPQMSVVSDVVRQVLKGHEPFPAVVVDGGWNVVDANNGLGVFTDGADPELLAEPFNLLRLALHPRGLAPYLANLGEWRAHVLGRLTRRIAVTADPVLTALYHELRVYPCDQPQPEVLVPGPGDIAVPLRLRRKGRQLAFLCTVATFDAALDVTLAELSIETYFPADARTAELLRERAFGSSAGASKEA